MNTFWLKIAGVAILVVGVIVGITVFTSSEPKQAREREPKPREKTVYDQWEEDEKELSAEPQYKEPLATIPSVQPSTKAVQQTTPVAPPPKPEFKKLNEIEEIRAQQLWEWVKNQRKMGRLPIMGYGQMVRTCRDIIQRWPESEYAFFAKRALADLPPRYHKMYNITKEEIDLGNLK
jgi:type IV secretory pathway VirB10-like protein